MHLARSRLARLSLPAVVLSIVGCLFLIPHASAAGSIPGVLTESAVLLTGTAPSASTEGISLTGVTAVRVVISGPSGQTITGGYIDCYYRPPSLARWTPCLTPSVTLRTGSRDAPTFDYEYLVGYGRLRWVPRAVTLSGAGTTVDVTYETSNR